MSIARAMREIDSRELTYWMAYYKVEPWGPRMDDIRMGMIASTIANCNRDVKKKPDPFQPIDYIPWAQERANPDSESVLFEDPEDQAQLVAMELFGVDLNRIKSEGKKVTLKRRVRG